MGVSIDVDSSNFAVEVGDASFQKTVIVDFFAQWCGPCQMLKPMLEKLVQEYDFVLAKIDIDQSPDLASAYKVEGVPDVRIVTQGKMYPAFTGVMPEPQLRAMMAQLNLQSGVDVELEAARSVIAAGNVEEGKLRLSQLADQHPDNYKVAIEAAKVFIQLDELGEAEKMLVPIEEYDRQYGAQAEALRNLIQLKVESQHDLGSPLDGTFAQAVQQTLAGDYESALSGFLSIVSQDRKYRNDSARKGMLVIFTLLGDEHELTKQYRQQLTRTLY